MKMAEWWQDDHIWSQESSILRLKMLNQKTYVKRQRAVGDTITLAQKVYKYITENFNGNLRFLHASVFRAPFSIQ